MEIHTISNLPSDPDITVILVKKSLDQCQDSKSGDGKNFSANTSMVNFAAHTQDEGKDDTSSILSPVSSWDVDSITAVDRCDLPTRTLHTSSLSYKNEDLFRICESPKSSHSAVALKTIQNSYTESEPEDCSECNNFSTFVDVNLGEPYVDENAQDKNNRPAVMNKVEVRRKSKTPFSACFPCMFKSKINDDD